MVVAETVIVVDNGAPTVSTAFQLVQGIGLGGEIIRSIRFDSSRVPSPAKAVRISQSIVAGMRGGWVGELVMRANDILLAFPAFLLAIMFAAVYGQSTLVAMIAIGIVYTPSFARVARASALGVMEQDYIEAAHSLGAGRPRLILRHVLPNILGPLIIQTSLSLAFAILAEAALSFLGLGAQPPTASWGLMLNEGRDFFYQAPWLAVFPGIAITLAVLAFNLP